MNTSCSCEHRCVCAVRVHSKRVRGCEGALLIPHQRVCFHVPGAIDWLRIGFVRLLQSKQVSSSHKSFLIGNFVHLYVSRVLLLSRAYRIRTQLICLSATISGLFFTSFLIGERQSSSILHSLSARAELLNPALFLR